MDHKEKFDALLEELEEERENLKALKKETKDSKEALLETLVCATQMVDVPKAEYLFLRDVHRSAQILWNIIKSGKHSIISADELKDLFGDLMEG